MIGRVANLRHNRSPITARSSSLKSLYFVIIRNRPDRPTLEPRSSDLVRQDCRLLVVLHCSCDSISFARTRESGQSAGSPRKSHVAKDFHSLAVQNPGPNPGEGSQGRCWSRFEFLRVRNLAGGPFLKNPDPVVQCPHADFIIGSSSPRGPIDRISTACRFVSRPR